MFTSKVYSPVTLLASSATTSTSSVQKLLKKSSLHSTSHPITAWKHRSFSMACRNYSQVFTRLKQRKMKIYIHSRSILVSNMWRNNLEWTQLHLWDFLAVTVNGGGREGRTVKPWSMAGTWSSCRAHEGNLFANLFANRQNRSNPSLQGFFVTERILTAATILPQFETDRQEHWATCWLDDWS